MKILYVTTIGGTMRFFRSLIPKLIAEGYEVDLAANINDSPVDKQFTDLGCKVFPLSCSRSFLDSSALKTIKEIKRIVSDGHYDIVHCHTPIASVCTRIACKKARKTGLKVIYTAHGFHFYKGAPFKNWLVYYPIEKICAHFTDLIITINKEDYECAKAKMKAKRVEYVPGVGIDTKKFAETTVDRNKKREELGIPKDSFLLLSVGELNQNKNQQVVIKALAQLKDKNFHYAVAGKGNSKEYLEQLAQTLGVEDQLHLLGYREDAPELYKIADVDVFPSVREGLGLAALEGMAAGLPLICSDNRGTRSYAENGKNAFVCNCTDADAFASSIIKMRDDDSLRAEMGKCAFETTKRYDVSEIDVQMLKIYERQE